MRDKVLHWIHRWFLKPNRVAIIGEDCNMVINKILDAIYNNIHQATQTKVNGMMWH